MNIKNNKLTKYLFIFMCLFFLTHCGSVFAQNVVTPAPSIIPMPSIDFRIGQAETPEQVSTSVQLMFYLAVITLAPSFLIMLTCFPRILVVLHFLRAALGTQQMPPNQILIGIALFLTMFLMGPTFVQINETALKPMAAGQITQDEALAIGMEPIRDFMFRQVEDKDLKLFRELDNGSYATIAEIPSRVLIPAFVIGELKKGFMIGFILYIPFIVIDMVVASTLMAMGMMMLPPAMISLPFKILLFVLVDGWNLVIGQLMQTFR